MTDVRKANRDDHAQIKAMIQQAGINPFGVHWKRFFVLEVDGTIVGCVQLKQHLFLVQELSSLVMIPSWQKKGLSKKLIRACIDEATKELFLVCDDTLVALYIKYGFRRYTSNDRSLFYRIHLAVSRLFWHRMPHSTAPVLMIHRP